MTFFNPLSAPAVAEARFHHCDLIASDMLMIVEPHQRVTDWFDWMHLSPQEYALSEDFLAQIIAGRTFLRSRAEALLAWLLAD